ncbi:MAG: fibronectin type III domain-containing protein [Candidatus Cloacimonetes bacterium]|jgi:hypothetical protein|nr:fibronectin type III domain-containing protein [Candidatus Cloacimonadota bacterium]MBT6994776.1 fibronectin type III domain-containing protein [Candidatus Cloacimonadota bacterium]MBT7469969.1 fibronectin type III domain-containing protein [Candidatus Cloacimonadota bacterium]
MNVKQISFHPFRLIIFLICLFASSLMAQIQSSSAVFSMGGGQSQSSSFKQFAVIGEMIIGESASNNYKQRSGFTIDIIENTAVPTTPLNVRIVVTTDEVGHVVRTITWDAVEGVDFYNVYACDTPTGEFVQINTEPITDTTFESAGGSIMKFYRVTANNGGVVTVSPPKSNFRN